MKFITPSNVDKTEWERLNNNLKLRLAPLHLQIGSCNDPVQIQVLGDQVSLEIARFCSEHSELFLQEEQNSPREKFITHSNKTVAQLQALKKSLRKEAFKDGGNTEKQKAFHECLKALSELKKRERHDAQMKTTAHQEKLFHKNRFQLARNAVNDSLNKESIQPTFTKAMADQYYPATYSQPKQINLPDLHWFPPQLSSPDSETFQPFDNSPIRPRDVRKALAKANKNSAPGPDGITYGVLSKLDSSNHTLATLYSKVLALGSPPPSWSESVVKPIHKKGEASNPSNFRMIASGASGRHFTSFSRTDSPTTSPLMTSLIPQCRKLSYPELTGA